MRKADMINELFARHGHVFQSQRLRDEFAKKTWYKPVRSLALGELPRNVQSYILNLKKPKNPMRGR